MCYLRISASVKPSTLFLRALGLPLFFGFLSSSLSSVSLSEPDERFFSLEPTSLSLSLAWAWKRATLYHRILKLLTELLEDKKHLRECFWDAKVNIASKQLFFPSPLTLLLELLLLGSMKMSSISRCFSSSSIFLRCSSGMMSSHSRMDFPSSSGVLSSMLEKLATCSNTQRRRRREIIRCWKRQTADCGTVQNSNNLKVP